MKVYVVSAGCYSDCHIEKIFLNKEKAEEYSKWVYESNEVEEYEINDDEPYRKTYVVTVDLRWYPDGDERIDVSSWKDVSSIPSYQCYYNYGSSKQITIYRTISSENFNKEFCENKYKKFAFDLKACVLSLEADGFNEKQIQEIIESKVVE